MFTFNQNRFVCAFGFLIKNIFWSEEKQIKILHVEFKTNSNEVNG